jgi:hypothetical protein
MLIVLYYGFYKNFFNNNTNNTTSVIYNKQAQFDILKAIYVLFIQKFITLILIA